MSEDLIVRCSAPTLAGIKTGSLFTLHPSSYDDFKKEILKLNRSVNKKGVRIIPLKVCDDHALVYIYRPAMLGKDLNDPVAMSILKRFGYSPASPERCIRYLISRLDSSAEFPHEIGLFLGYPPLDVDGFISNPYEGFYETGYWKVYSDVDGARHKFRRFSRCTEVYMHMFNEGRTLEQLVV